MQSDFRRAHRRKKTWHRLLAVFVITMLAGMTLAWMRGCTDQFKGPYNTDYRPMDEVRKNQSVEQKH